jgi:hypothetical protein
MFSAIVMEKVAISHLFINDTVAGMVWGWAKSSLEV